MSDTCKRSDGLVWHDVFIAMLWTLLRSGVDGDVLKDMVEYAIEKQNLIKTSDVSKLFGEEELN